MIARFTPESRRVIAAARYEALRMNHPAISSGHLLLGLLRPESGPAGRALSDLGVTRAVVEALVAERSPKRPGDRSDGFEPGDAEALRSIGIDLDEVRRRVEATFGPRAFAPARVTPIRRWTRTRPRLTDEAKQALRLGRREVSAAGRGPSGRCPAGSRVRGSVGSRSRRRYGADHLLLGVSLVAGGIGATILRDLGVTVADLRSRLRDEGPAPSRLGRGRAARGRPVRWLTAPLRPASELARLVGRLLRALGRLIGRLA
ncbi:MAG: Clp protease N-terminal domain-containing protein, partial [Frankia sp.]